MIRYEDVKLKLPVGRGEGTGARNFPVDTVV